MKKMITPSSWITSLSWSAKALKNVFMASEMYFIVKGVRERKRAYGMLF